MPSIERARESLVGLSVGDAFGDRFNTRTVEIGRCLLTRTTPPAPWTLTDDSWMACSVFEVLRDYGELDPERLAESFVRRYEPGRGYGPKMKQVLPHADSGHEAMTKCAALFGGRGSYGNGAVMRIAPLGAFYDEPEQAAREAIRSACSTHAHPEAEAGAAAIAVAACVMAQRREFDAREFFEVVVELTPDSDVKRGVLRASETSVEERPLDVAKAMRADRDITCQVTTPFCLWATARNPGDYVKALWDVVSAGGDRDTHAAIVGGLVAARLGADAIPPQWLKARESLPIWTDQRE